MRNVYYVMKRELGVYFSSPIAYVVIAIYLAIMGGLGGLLLYFSREATMRYVFNHAVALLFSVLVTQLITMRLMADERRTGTLELLLTAPLRDWEVIAGKYLASLVVFLVMTALTAYFPLVLVQVGNPDIGPILSGYLGYILLGAALLAVGLFASSVTQNQIVAAVVGIGIALLLWLVGALEELVGTTMASIVAYLPLFAHYSDMVRGVIDTSDIIYYVTLVALFLFLSTRVVESERWK